MALVRRVGILILATDNPPCGTQVDYRTDPVHYRHYGGSVIFVRIIQVKFAFDALIPVQRAFTQLERYRINTGSQAGKQEIAVTPAKNIIVSVRFTPARFDDRNTGQQSPVNLIIIGGMDEILCQIRYWAVQFREELCESYRA